MTEVRFGPGGNAASFTAEGHKNSEEAPGWLAARGLTAYEYQCGRGIHSGEAMERRLGQAAAAYDIQMSIHAPYFINLSSDEPERVEKNIGYLLRTAQTAERIGAVRIVVHCGGLGKRTREEAMRNSHENVRRLLAAMEAEGHSACTICLETMGKQNVIGSAEELCALVAADDRLLPCIDFGHLNCRTGGRMSTRQDVSRLFDLMEHTIGLERTRRFHAHFSHIAYGPKGEIRHLTFADTEYGPDFLPVAQEVAARGYTPVFICESAGTQAEDAIEMQRIFREQKQAGR